MSSRPTQLRFAVIATDTAFFRLAQGHLEVRLVPVHRPPHILRRWGLPGGLIDPKETAPAAAARHLKTKGGIADAWCEQLYTFSALKRDPRGRVVAVAYLGLGNEESITYEPNSDAQWFPIHRLPALAYDHREIIRVAVQRIANKLSYSTIGQLLLPKTFTLSELQELYEALLARRLDKRNFRKKILHLGLVVPTKQLRRVGASRPAELYRFKKQKIQMIDIL